MNRRGFALLAVLWTLAAVMAAIGGALVALRDGELATRNRLLLARGRWAAEACLAIAAARWGTPRWGTTAEVDLGRGVRCRVDATDPASRLNVNTADADILLRLFAGTGMSPAAAAALADSLVARRRAAPFASVDEVEDVAAVPAAILDQLTADGPGTVNANAASPLVLSALPGLGAEAVAMLMRRRAGRRPVTSLDELVGGLSPVGRGELLAAYGNLSRQLVFGSAYLQVTATGWVDVGPPSPRTRIRLLAVPLPSRFAVIRRWLE